MIGQAYEKDAQDFKYIPSHVDPEGETGSRFNQDKSAFNKLAFHGKAGNLSSRPQAGRNANSPRTENASRFQRSRKKK